MALTLPQSSSWICFNLKPGRLPENGPQLHSTDARNSGASENEQLTSASARIALDELGLPATALPRARLMGAWDHCYDDSAFDPAVSTHYVNLPHWLALSAAEAAALTLPQGPDQQHARWQWLPLDQAARDESVHAYVRVYARWLRDNAS